MGILKAMKTRNGAFKPCRQDLIRLCLDVCVSINPSAAYFLIIIQILRYLDFHTTD